MRHAILALCLASPALAETCPAVPDHVEALSGLIAAAQEAPNEMAARPLTGEMWALWRDAPDTYSQELLDEGILRRESYDYAGAMKALDALVAYCPDYAEGYNQRAFVNFLRQDYEAALPDLERTVALSPRHVAALAGQALTLAALQRNGEAALALRAALALNPWLGERHMLPALEKDEKEL